MAVDNLIEALVAAGINPLRVASPGKVKESVAEYSLEAKMEAHPCKKELDEVTAELAKLHETREETQEKLKELSWGDSPRATKLKAKLGKGHACQLCCVRFLPLLN